MTVTTYSTTRATRRPGGRTRVVVGGVDATNLCRVDSYELLEPYAYGNASLTFVKVGAYGSDSDYPWMKPGAVVTIGRVMPDDSTVVDYRGFLTTPTRDGRDLGWAVGGQLVGHAAILDKQPLVVDGMYDLGRYIWQACNVAGINVSPVYGPVTGIELAEQGNMTWSAWLDTLLALSMDAEGVQKTLRPVVHGSSGAWEVVDKDYDTVHVTFFHDDARVKLSGLQSPVEDKVTRVFVRGTTPSGEVVRFARIPTVMPGQDPGYPIAGHASFGVGTTDADTTTGSGVTAFQRALVQRWLLAANVVETGVYTTTIAAAVKKLQRMAGLAQTGTMTYAAWQALFDEDVVGSTPSAARIFPAAVDPRVEKWLYTPSGAYWKLNPNYDPSVLLVDRTIEDLDGLTKAQMVDVAQGILTRAAGDSHWVGRIDLNQMTGFVGDWDASDWEYLQAHPELIYPIRDLRAGVNAKLAMFEGGVHKFHVAAISVSGDGSASLTVDTQGRDYTAISAVLRRDREARANVAWQRFGSNRRTKKAGEQITFDENCGRIWRPRTLPADQWTTIPIWMGRSGSVPKTFIQLDDPTEFSAFFVVRQWDDDQANRVAGDPLVMHTDDEARVSIYDIGRLADLIGDEVIPFAAGDGDQPLGYKHRLKFTKENRQGRTSAPLVGSYYSLASWNYSIPPPRCQGTLVIRPASATSIQPQRVFFALPDSL